jgi:WD40 repeat protein
MSKLQTDTGKRPTEAPSLADKQSRFLNRVRAQTRNLPLLLLAWSAGCIGEDSTGPSAITTTPQGVPEASRSAAETEGLLGLFPNRPPLILKKVACNAFAVFRDGSHIVVANHNKVEVWDMHTGKKAMSLKHPDLVLDVALSPDDKSLLTATIGATSPVRHWELSSGRKICEYASPFAPARPQAPGEDYRTQWHVPHDVPDVWVTPINSYRSDAGLGFTAIAFSPSGRTIALGCNDGNVLLLEAETGQHIGKLVTDSLRVHSIVFSPDATRVITASRNNTLYLWDSASKQLIQTYEWNAHEEPNEKEHRVPLAFSADGTQFAFVRSPNIHFMDARTGSEIRQLTDLGNRVLSLPSFSGCVSFLPAGRLLQNVGVLLNVQDRATGELISSHRCRSGIDPSTYPNVEYVRYLPDIDACIAVDCTDNENTMHQNWTCISLVPRSEFWAASAPMVSAKLGFTVKFPEEPRFRSWTADRDSTPVAEAHYDCYSTGATFKVAVLTYPTPIATSDYDKHYDTARDQVSEDDSFVITKDEKIAVGPHTAREVWTEQPLTSDGTVQHCVFVCSNNREYRVTAITRRGTFPADKAASFLRSFALNN